MRYGRISLPDVAISINGKMDGITIDTHHLNRTDPIIVRPSLSDSSRYLLPE